MENKLSSYDTALEDQTKDVVAPSELVLEPINQEILEVELDAQGDAMQALIEETPEVVNLGNELNKVEGTSPVAYQSTEKQSAEKTETKEVRADILSSFQERFGITQEALEGIEGFADLTPGQQRMALENLGQLTIGRIHEDAIDGHSEDFLAKQKDAKFMGRVWNGVKESFGKKFDVIDREKKLATDIAKGGIDVHKGALGEFVKGMKNVGPEIAEKPDGTLEIQLVETKGLTPELAKEAEAFNEQGNALARIPYEWSLESATTEQQNAFKGAKESYERERGILMGHMETAGGAEMAMRAMAKTESTIEMQRFIQTCPDAAKELEQIENQNAWTAALKSVGTERGVYMALGFVGRTALGAMAGFVAAPATAMALGGIRGWRKAGDALRDQDSAQRAGKEISGDIRTQKNMIESVRDEEEKDAIGYRGAVEKVDALVKKIQGKESSSRDTSELVESLRQRMAYTQQKISEGKMVFGSKDEKLANQYALTRSLAEAEALIAGRTAIDRNGNNAEERLERMLGKKDDAVDHARTMYKVKQAARAGLIGGALAGIGASAADLLKWYNGGDSAIADLLGKEPAQFSESQIQAVEETIKTEPIVNTEGNIKPDVVNRLNQEANARSVAEYMTADTAGKKFIAQSLGMTVTQVDSKISNILSLSTTTSFEQGFTGSSVLTEKGDAEGINGLDLPTDYAFPAEAGKEWVETRTGLNVLQEDLLTAKEGTPLYTVQAGDNLSKIFAKEIPGSTNQEVMRALIKMTPDELKSMGVTSGNMNLIRHGDSINIAKMQELLGIKTQTGGLEQELPKATPPTSSEQGFEGTSALSPRPPVEGIRSAMQVFPNTAIPPAVPGAEDAELVPRKAPTPTAAEIAPFIKTTFAENEAEPIIQNRTTGSGEMTRVAQEQVVVSERTRMIAEKWGTVAKEGIGENPNWQVVRGERAMDIYNAKLPRGEGATIESARAQMQGLFSKAQAMGFRPSPNESAGAYLDRMAKELSSPPTDAQIVERGHTMWNLMNKQVMLRGSLDFNSPAYSAQNVLSQKILPGMESTPQGKEFIQVQTIMQKIYQGTGVRPAQGENIDAYAERALRVQLQKTPTLHIDMILAPKQVIVPPTGIPTQVPSSVREVVPPKPLRWDQQA